MPIEPWWETNPARTPRQELGMVSPELTGSRSLLVSVLFSLKKELTLISPRSGPSSRGRPVIYRIVAARRPLFDRSTITHRRRTPSDGRGAAVRPICVDRGQN